MELFENLSELCNTCPQNVPVGVKFPLQKIAKNLPQLLTNGYFSNIMVPAQKFRTLVLPRINTNRNTKHNPFPEYEINQGFKYFTIIFMYFYNMIFIVTLCISMESKMKFIYIVLFKNLNVL